MQVFKSRTLVGYDAESKVYVTLVDNGSVIVDGARRAPARIRNWGLE